MHLDITPIDLTLLTQPCIHFILCSLSHDCIYLVAAQSRTISTLTSRFHGIRHCLLVHLHLFLLLSINYMGGEYMAFRFLFAVHSAKLLRTIIVASIVNSRHSSYLPWIYCSFRMAFNIFNWIGTFTLSGFSVWYWAFSWSGQSRDQKICSHRRGVYSWQEVLSSIVLPK